MHYFLLDTWTTHSSNMLADWIKKPEQQAAVSSSSSSSAQAPSPKRDPTPTHLLAMLARNSTGVLGKQTVPVNRSTTSTNQTTVRNRVKESSRSVCNCAPMMCASVCNRARMAMTTGLDVMHPVTAHNTAPQVSALNEQVTDPHICAESGSR